MAGKQVKKETDPSVETPMQESIPVPVPTVPKPTGKEAITGKYMLMPIKTTWLHNMDPKHDGALLFTGTFSMICPERDHQTGLIKTGLTDVQARELESSMMLKPNSLSPYNKDFWADFKIFPRVSKDGLTLDATRSDMDKLQIAFLKVHSKVATSRIAAQENPLFEYLLTNEEAEAKFENNKFAGKREAYKRLEKLTLEDSINFLIVYKQGKYKVSTGSTPDFINSTMAKVVEESPEEFMELLDNPMYNEFVFLRKCIINGLIRNKGGIYETMTGDIIGDSFEKAVYNLSQPNYNGVKISLLAKLESK